MWNHLPTATARQTVLTRCAAVVILVLVTAQGAHAADGLPILFLGDQGHHEPSKRYGWLENHLLAAGFAPTYTENVDDLTGGKLDHYDALLVYANIASASPALEKAIVDYVESGHAFVPIHCASACFGNSKPLIALMGASFRSHMTGVFTPAILDHEHPLMQGFAGFNAWDETYVHADHNPVGRTVLAVRKDPAGDEPWTWVRTQGKGRVFYTASGHDERTWCDPAFQDLIVRGTAWAIGDKAKPILDATVADALRRAQRAPLTMEPRPTVQNYEKRTPYPEYQQPLAPKASMDWIHTEAGFDLQLFASEPDIVRPIAFTWDHRGRLWVVETTDYPSVFTDRDQGHDRILICADTNGDGKADKFTVFADHLNIPTGIVLVNGGALISQAPDFIFLKDTDGDDQADVRKRVFADMWSKGDTHAGPSNLHYGFDNRIYGAVGYAGFKGTIDGNASEFRQGIFRFSRAYGGMQFLGQYTNNTWGMGFNEAGELFGSTANNGHHFYTPIPQPYARGVVGMDEPAVLNSVRMDSHYAAHALTGRIRQVDVMGGYTAAAGHNLYTARAFPQRYWNRAAFVNEPTMHLVHQGFLVRDGSGWTEGPDGINLLASEDEWVAPVFSEVGPDGALWVSDWYNFVVQHNPTPSVDHGGFATTTGAGGAHVNPLRDNQHGRIYRVVWRGAKPAPKLSLDPADGAQLAATLANDNLFWRLTAQRLLVERGKTDVVPALIALARDQGMDQVGINGGAIHALWTLHGLNALSGDALAVAVAALKHPSAAVRRNAVQVLPPGAASAAAMVASGILADVDLNVRLAAFLAAADQPADAALG
nr:ThuA domain-containing protein [Planctomycetota bacterium]